MQATEPTLEQSGVCLSPFAPDPCVKACAKEKGEQGGWNGTTRQCHTMIPRTKVRFPANVCPAPSARAWTLAGQYSGWSAPQPSVGQRTTAGAPNDLILNAPKPSEPPQHTLAKQRGVPRLRSVQHADRFYPGNTNPRHGVCNLSVAAPCSSIWSLHGLHKSE